MQTLTQTFPQAYVQQENSAYNETLLFLDIETTGFSARSACVYLIGCAYLTTNGWETRQFFAETPDDEADVLQQFFSFADTPAH